MGKVIQMLDVVQRVSQMDVSGNIFAVDNDVKDIYDIVNEQGIDLATAAVAVKKANEKWSGLWAARNQLFWHMLNCAKSVAVSKDYFQANLAEVTDTGYSMLNSSGDVPHDKIIILKGLSIDWQLDPDTLLLDETMDLITAIRKGHAFVKVGKTELKIPISMIPSGSANLRLEQMVRVAATAGTALLGSAVSAGEGFYKFAPALIGVGGEALHVSLRTSAVLPTTAALAGIDVRVTLDTAVLSEGRGA